MPGVVAVDNGSSKNRAAPKKNENQQRKAGGSRQDAKPAKNVEAKAELSVPQLASEPVAQPPVAAAESIAPAQENAPPAQDNTAAPLDEAALKLAAETKQVDELFSAMTGDVASDAAKKAAAALVALVSADIRVLSRCKVAARIQTLLDDIKNKSAREGALLAFTSLAQSRSTEPYLVPLLPVILNTLGDKITSVRQMAETAASVLTAELPPHALRLILPSIFDGMKDSKKFQTKVGALKLLSEMAARSPNQIQKALPDIVPVVSQCMWDTKTEVKQQAEATMMDICKCCGNNDIQPFLPTVIGCIAEPTKVPDAVHGLGATTFVQEVEAAALAVMVPLLMRGLNERAPAIRRKAAVIIDNMCKLVENPADAQLFIPTLLPALDRVKEESADPELRGTATKAHATLLKARGTKEIKIETAEEKAAHEKAFLAVLHEILKANDAVVDEVAADYANHLAFHLSCVGIFEAEQWDSCLTPLLAPFTGAEVARKVVAEFNTRCLRQEQETAEAPVEEEAGEELCNCEFSLAYGALILLSNTKMRLLRGHRYGLCGPNGAGKSTLMRAIANGQVEGFPAPDVLRTVYVAHDLQASNAEQSVLEFCMAEEALKGVPKDEMITVLASVGFDAEKQKLAVNSLSGGWKMKLELARAMLMHADILLLDEPTNHLDVTNVKWLVDYLNSLSNVTSMIVSHDSGFLDNVCTNIIHYENRKLKSYKGNLSEFVKMKPEAKAYYELSATNMKFTFPEPGFLEGIKSKDRAILKMTNVSFSYPGSSKKQVENISCMVSLSSRIGCVGPNGAGKSTIIKLLTGETEPCEGEVWKHPNLRVAYVAQHAFHHLEEHVDKTPQQYVLWRYQYGDDRELLQKDSRQITDEERKLMEKLIVVEGENGPEKRQIESLVGRRKGKKAYEYECKWRGLAYDKNTWMDRAKLESLGFFKMLQQIDDKEAARAAQVWRPLTAVNIQKHFEDFGLDAEFTNHNLIKGLSGGQKVKVVLGAAMWNNPHIVVLDEPTNYLDRDALGALAEGIKAYGGGVVVISHNSEFTKTICPETWNVANGRILIDGATNVKAGQGEKIVDKPLVEEMTDAHGNTIKIKKKKEELTRKERKAREKKIADAKKRGEEYYSSDEEW